MIVTDARTTRIIHLLKLSVYFVFFLLEMHVMLYGDISNADFSSERCYCHELRPFQIVSEVTRESD